MLTQPSQLFTQAAASVVDLLDGGGLDEEMVRQCVVLRLLQAAGHDVWNPLEVIPQPGQSSSAPSLLVTAGEMFRIEILPRGAVADAFWIEQVIRRAIDASVCWAILTDGRDWKIIDATAGNEEQQLGLMVALSRTPHSVYELWQVLSLSSWQAGMTDVLRELGETSVYRQGIAELRAKWDALSDLEVVALDDRRLIDAGLRLGLITDLEAEGYRSFLGVVVSDAGDGQELVTSREASLPENVFPFYIDRPTLKASVLYDRASGEWTILKGSQVNVAVNLRGKLARKSLKKGDLERQGEVLVFTRDVVCGTPSEAAVLVVGKSQSGWRSWRSKDNRPAQEWRPEHIKRRDD